MPAKKIKLSFSVSSVQEIAEVFEIVLSQLIQKEPICLSRQTRIDVKLAFHEAVVNTVVHAKELEKNNKVEGYVFLDQNQIGFEVIDHGRGFDLKKIPVPNFSKLTSSGRGLFLMKQLGDEIQYRRGKNKNVFLFKRFLIGQNANLREIDFLYNISQAIVRGLDLEEVYPLILDQALEIFHVDRASILIFDEKEKVLRITASRGLPQKNISKIKIKPGEGVSGYVFQHGRALLIEDIEHNQRGLEKKEGYQSHSFISVPMIYLPLKTKERTIGVINLTDKKDGKPFTRKDLQLLSTIANQAAACLYIRDLVNEVKKRERLEQELDYVRQIQSSYLPQHAPKIEGIDMSGGCDMVDSVGGDYFDYYLANKHLYLVIADVSGHDLKSAMGMFNFRSQLICLLNLEWRPHEILRQMNSTLYEDLQSSGHFVSALIMRLDPDTGEYELASAGHYPPLFFEGHSCVVEPGLVLGIEKKEKYPSSKGRLKKGDGVLLFTDGVIEAMGEKNEFFGLDRLKGSLKKFQSKKSQDIVRSIIQESKNFRSQNSPIDDITVLSLKYG